MVHILLSPAKNLTFEKTTQAGVSHPVFLDKAALVHQSLQKLSPKELIELMEISSQLAALNWERNQVWSTQGKFPAAFCFNGEAYRGLAIESMNEKALAIAQEKLHILSGLYGMLRPLDLINPYRLEMGRGLAVDGNTTLYQFWSDTLTSYLNSILSSEDTLVNVTSGEYLKVINKKKLQATLLECQFKDYKNGMLKTLVVYTKKARGAMARFIIENNINSVDDIKKFNEGGYIFDESLSTKTTFVFTR